MKIFELGKIKLKNNIAEDVKFKKAMQICESLLSAIGEDDGDIEWEPQPQMKGVKGITHDTGVGARDRMKLQQQKEKAAMEKAWGMLNKMLKQYQASNKPDSIQKERQIKAKMQELQAKAKAKGINLSGETLGLAPN